MSGKENFPDYETVEYHLVYSELINAARQRGTVTYQELAHVVGLPLKGNFMGKRLGDLLGAVSQNETNQGRPMLSAVAVTVEGISGPGFFKLARDQGRLHGNTREAEAAFWEEQKRQCYDIWKQKFHQSEAK